MDSVLTEEQVEVIDKAFKYADENGVGYLSSDQFNLAVNFVTDGEYNKSRRFNLDKDETNSLMLRADIGEGGYLGFEGEILLITVF